MLDFEVIVYSEKFAYVMLDEAVPHFDPEFKFPSDDAFFLWVKDSWEKSILVEQTPQLEALLVKRGEPNFAQTDYRMLRIQYNDSEDSEIYSTVNLLAKICPILDEKKVGFRMISSFDFDYILVEQQVFPILEEVLLKSFKVVYSSINKENKKYI